MVSTESARAHEHEQMRKIFVGGLNWETSDEALKKYFSKYGNIVDCVVMRDNNGKSRGFGFVTFDKVSCVDDCIAAKPHRLDDRDIEPKRAVPKDEASNPAALARTRKIFVGGLASSTSEEDIKTYFTGLCNNFNRGNVLEVELKRDRNTERIRGFAFVTFDDEDVVEKIVSMKYHEIKLKECEVKKAESRAAMQRRREQDEKTTSSGRGSPTGSSGHNSQQGGFNPANMGGWGGPGFPFFSPGGFWGGPGQSSGGGSSSDGQSGGSNRGKSQGNGNSGGNQGGNMGGFGPMGPFGPGFGFPGFGFPGFAPGFGFYGMPFGWGGQGFNQDGSSDSKGGGNNSDRNDNRGSGGYNTNNSSNNQGSYNAGNQSDYNSNSGGNFPRMTPADYMSMAANMGNFGGPMGGSGGGSSGGGGGSSGGANAMANMASMGFNNPWGGYPFNFSNFSGGTDDKSSGASAYADYQLGTYNQGSSSYGPSRGSSSLKKSPDTKRSGYQPY